MIHGTAGASPIACIAFVVYVGRNADIAPSPPPSASSSPSTGHAIVVVLEALPAAFQRPIAPAVRLVPIVLDGQWGVVLHAP